MSNKRVPHLARLLGLALLLFSSGFAEAQKVTPDLRAAPKGPKAATSFMNCGVIVGEGGVVIGTSPATTKSTVFTTIPGARVKISNSKSSICVKIKLYGTTKCDQGATTSVVHCFVRAFMDGSEVAPTISQAPTFDDNYKAMYKSGETFGWVRRVGAGNHTVELQWRTDNAQGIFGINNWVMEVELTY